jgi:hypothetical protein
MSSAAQSTPATSVVVPKGAPAEAAAATPMKGGMMLSPLPLTGGKKRRGTRRLSKKVIKMLKAMPKAKLAKMMKGGQGMDGSEAETVDTGAEGAARKKKGKTARKSRRSTLLY